MIRTVATELGMNMDQALRHLRGSLSPAPPHARRPPENMIFDPQDFPSA